MKIPLKQWRYQEAERLQVSEGVISSILYRRKFYPRNVMRKNKRVVLVSEDEHIPWGYRMIRAIKWGDALIPLKDFAISESQKLGVTINAIYMKAWRGKYRVVTVPRNQITMKENAN